MTQLGSGRGRVFKRWPAAVALTALTLVTTGALAQAGFSIVSPPASGLVGSLLRVATNCEAAVPASNVFSVLGLALVLLAIAAAALRKRAIAIVGALLGIAFGALQPSTAGALVCTNAVTWRAESPSQTFTGSGPSFSFTPTQPGVFVVSATSGSASSSVTIPVCAMGQVVNACGVCGGGGGPLDDGNPCTTDSCGPSGVTHVPIANGGTCSDGNACTVGEICSNGACGGGAPISVDDGNTCTQDSCAPTLGVQHTPVALGTSCTDGNVCTLGDACNGSGQCAPGPAVDVDDDNECTADLCNSGTGQITHSPLPAGTACDPLDICYDDGICDGQSRCLPGEPLPFDDGDPCTIETCDPIAGFTRRDCAPVDLTVATAVVDASSWVYSGAEPLQTGVSATTIKRASAATLQGRVLSEAGLPLGGVSVSIRNHPELGQTLTQTNGEYLLVVNGGGSLVVQLAMSGFLDSERAVEVPWASQTHAEDTALIQADTALSVVDLLDASQPFQVAQASQIADADGTRQATALVPAGTVATMRHADGTTELLDEMNIRITEFTVGPNGPEKMPASLPPLSQYTYAFEINADEAVNVGAKSITFSQPLVYYVDNFLNFPSGTPVPLGSYDRERGVWVPEQNGIVLKIVSVTNGLADVSIDADTAAETPAELAAFGITPDERAKLAALYPVGKSLWRVLIPHFTQPWDCNWSAIPPPDAVPPPPQPPKPDIPDPCEGTNASTIECQNQVLRESVSIAGTPYGMHYSSQRVPGWEVGRTREIVVTGPSVPSSVTRVELNVEVGGKTFSQVFGAAPNRKVTFTWDGLDALQRGSMGYQHAKIDVGFFYNLIYTRTSSFGSAGNGVAITGDRARGEVSLSRQTNTTLGVWDQRRLGLGGWSLSMHHAYDPAGQTLYRGDGTKQAATGVGLAAYAKVLNNGGLGGGPRSVAAGADGSAYVLGLGYAATGAGPDRLNVLARIGADGVTTILAGQPDDPFDPIHYSGDGGPANQARLYLPEDLELGPDGSIYIADTRNHRVRKITPDGIIRTIAGTGVLGFSGDGGPATQAQINNPLGLGLGADGALYLADRDNYRVRRIGTDGIITTVAGIGSCSSVLENVPATTPGDCMFPYDVAVEVDGGLLVADGIRGRVRRVDSKGRVRTAAGCSTGSCPNGAFMEGVPANQNPVGQAEKVVAMPDRSFYFTNRGGYLHYVDPEGIRYLIAGGGSNFGPANGAPARSLGFGLSFGVAVGPAGILLADNHNQRLVTLRASSVASSPGEAPRTVASTDGTEVYNFDAQGRHQTTRDAITGAIRYQFAYESHGFLSSVTDAYGNVTNIERNAAGTAVAITGPYGQRTTFGYDANGYLATVTNPLSQSVGMTYTPSGLLTSYQNARGNPSSVQYDARGRLLTDQDAAGGSKTLTRSELSDGWQVAYASSDEGTKTFEVRTLLDGRQTRTTTFADGTSAQQVRATNGTFTTTHSDGTIETDQRLADPRYGIETPIVAHSVKLPSGLTYTESATRTVTLSNQLDPLSVTALVTNRTINGRTWSESYNASTKTWTLQTPVGRRTFRRINALGDLVEVRTDTLLAHLLGYDPFGRLSTQTQGSRQSLLTYFTSGPAAGYLESARNPLLQTTTFTRDPLGRTLTELDPQTNLTGFSWDPDGNLSSVTPPGRPAHGMDYTPVNLMNEYSPPALASLPDGRTVYEYNLARQVERSTRPDGLVTTYAYDPAGRLSDITTPGGIYHRDYYGLIPCAGCAAGRLSHLTSPDAVALDYNYDGQLLTRATWSGPVSGAVAFGYGGPCVPPTPCVTDFKVRTETVTSASGSAAYQFGFDNDMLRTCASPTNCTTPGTDALTLTYGGSGTHGLPLGSALGTVIEALTYNTVGELATQTGKVGTTTVFSETYDSVAVPRDALGRIKRKVETINGTTGTWDYTYDLAGRLQTVLLNGTAYETYSYDSNGNRLTVVKPGGTTTAAYDDQDRLLTNGPWTYTYTPNGELLTKSNSATGANWAYAYDVFGNLKRVDQPTGDVIEYLIDGQNRRVGRKRNGVLLKQWLYGDQLHPVAELDGSGALVSRFIWASGKNAPDLVVAGGVTYRVFTDQLGSPRALVNATSGAVAAVARHDAWGVVLEDSVSALMPFGFAGGIYDVETGLVRFGARDYDASIGRWMSKDPIRFGGSQGDLYAYVANDPVNSIDPSGLFFCNNTDRVLLVGGGTGTGSGHGSGSKFATGLLAPGQCVGPGVPLDTPDGPLYDVDAVDCGSPDGRVDPPKGLGDLFTFGGDKVPGADDDHFGYCAVSVFGFVVPYPCYEF